MIDFPVYLINLDDSTERLRSAAGQLDRAGLAFERVPAFDGRTRPAGQFPGHDPDAARRRLGRPMRGGEIGCYLSHLDCLDHFLRTGSELCLVLEDDVLLDAAFVAGLEGLLDWLGPRRENWDIVHLAPVRHKIFTPLGALGAGHGLTHAHYFPMTTTALLWTRTGAQAFVAQNRAIMAPIDMQMRHWLARRDRGLAVWPPLAATTGADSEIASHSQPKRSSGGRHPLYPLIRQVRMAGDRLWAMRHKWQGKAGQPR
ncbi:glycosyltransferase family 25 protein [Paracoccus everestensis]|uniref:glycosyltransferase family 25 protein n=1 Tax=Paracoccus everestensis TaxID=2903900 RepID=UPI001F4244C7|nr:glycosyltransferase family 25 protein [Paracoccus everestensis]